MKKQIVAALAVALMSPTMVAAQTAPQAPVAQASPARAMADAAVQLNQRVCVALGTEPNPLPTDPAGLASWLSANQLTVGVPSQFQPPHPIEAGLMADSVLFSRTFENFAMVLQVRRDGRCVIFLMGEQRQSSAANDAAREAISASTYRWTSSGDARPGPEGATGRWYDGTNGAGNPVSMFHITGGPRATRILGVVGPADSPAQRQQR
jgi:hypothetical protein